VLSHEQRLDDKNIKRTSSRSRATSTAVVVAT
jgi:hypothetical protein